MTKLKIVMPKTHNSLIRQIAKTKHEIYMIKENIDCYDKIFDDEKYNNYKMISHKEFKETARKYDLLFLHKGNQINQYNNERYAIKKCFGWTNVGDVFPNIKHQIKSEPLLICTSNNWKLRPQDRVLTIGIDEKEFPPRDHNSVPIPQILCPLNNYKTVGELSSPQKMFNGFTVSNYFQQVVGWDWNKTILNNKFIKVCGLNPKLGKTEIPRELYKKYLKSSAGILVPSPFKHHANVTAETMMSKNCVITRPSVPFRVNPSPLKGGHDCIMVKSENELLNHCNNEFITNRKRQRTIGENALLTAQTSFNMKICINRWEEFFEHVISFS